MKPTLNFLFLWLLCSACVSTKVKTINTGFTLEGNTRKLLVKELEFLPTLKGLWYYQNYVDPYLRPPFDTYYSPEVEWDLKRTGFVEQDSSTFKLLAQEGFGYLLTLDLLHKKNGVFYSYVFPFEVDLANLDPMNYSHRSDEQSVEVHLSISLYGINEQRFVYRSITKTRSTPLLIPGSDDSQHLVNPIGVSASLRKSLRKGLKQMVNEGFLSHSQGELITHLSNK